MIEAENPGTYVEDDKGQVVLVSNFTAKIEEEHKYIDGKNIVRKYLISGMIQDEEQELVLVDATDFAGMQWVTQSWGSQAIIFPKAGAKELLRTSMQIHSKPKITNIYTHLGWAKINKKDTYLSYGCALTDKKRITGISVKVPADLKRYTFPPIQIVDPHQAKIDSLEMKELGPPEIAWALIGSTYRAPIGKSDYVFHITGRTGTYKSEIAAIYQSHWGECPARDLPASWASTANALEALCYRAKDCLITCDDFIPSGTSWQVKAQQKTADQIIRGQGNQSGRARLTDKSMLQETMYPRGLILSTGEDTPEGHSVRARMMIAELSPGEIDTNNLTIAQNVKKNLAESMAGYIQWLAIDLDDRRKEIGEIEVQIRDENLGIGHSRTPSTMASILSGVFMFLRYLEETKTISIAQMNELYTEAKEQIIILAGRQIDYLTAADPADQFLEILRGILAMNAGHIKGTHGGIPKDATVLGWTTIGDEPISEWKPHGPRLGWVDDYKDIIYLDATIAYDTIRRHSRGAITITRGTLYKRLREAGYIAQIDTARQRNTIRVQLENASRQVLALHKKSITEGEQHGSG